MTNQKSTKRALAASVLSLLLCCTMLLGTTFAWFTDSASTGVNTIQSGNLDMEVYHQVNGEWVAIDGATDLFRNVNGEPILWEPGVTATETFKIVNAGNLALKYAFYLTYTNATETADGKTLADVLSCGVDGYASDAEGKLEDIAMFNNLLAGEENSFTINIAWDPSDIDNDYNVEGGLSIDLGVKVFATQFTYENDATGNQYDKDATLPDVWDGKTIEAISVGEDGKYHITSAAQFAWIMKETSQGLTNSWNYNKTFVLDCDIDFVGRTISGIGGLDDNMYFIFDGNGHTISNFVINGKDEAHQYDDEGEMAYLYAGLFQQVNGTIQNLTVRNATVIGDQHVGVIASNADNATITNCKVYDSTIMGTKKVGAIVGYTAGATIANNYAENCNVYASAAREDQATIYGFDNGSTFTNNAEPVNCIVKTGVTTYVGEDVNIKANEKVAYVADATVTVDVSEGFNRIYSDDATFVNCVFDGEGKLWLKDTATFINCTFNTEINNAEPVVGTVTFENCTFNKAVHFAPASAGAGEDGKFFVADGCEFKANLTVQGFETVTLKNCTLSGSNWANKNMISYCSLVIDNCSFTTGIRLSYLDTSRVTCTNGSVDLVWYGGSATVGDN